MKRTLCLLALCSVAAPALASRTVVYSTNFESFNPDQYWFNAHIEINAWPQFTDFNGRFTNSHTDFIHPQPSVQLPPGQPATINPGDGSGGGGGGGGGGGAAYVQYYLTFDFYAIDAWTDQRFNVVANGTNVFSETFSNFPSLTQSFRTPDVGPTALAFNGSYNDSIYRTIDLPFTIANATDAIDIRFADAGGMNTQTYQSWGIDNVTISYEVVPAPSGLAGLGLGGIWGLRRRRR